MPTITIPQKLIKKEEELLVVPRKEYEELCKIAKLISKDQAWFWTEEWQAKEREADQDIRRGRVSKPYKTKRELESMLQRLKENRKKR